jgi:transposase-like protein
MIEAQEIQIENTSRRKKRRVFSSMDKKKILTEAKESTVYATAKKHSLNTSQLRTWRKQFLAGATDE